jgi:hypothetical protein
VRASAAEGEGGVAAAEQTSPPSIAPGPDDEDDDGVNDSGVEQPVARQAHNLEVAGSSPAPATNKDCAQQRGRGRRHNAHQHDGSFVPKRLLHSAGMIHAATTRGAARPVPVPEHEPEVARQVREEVEEIRTRRRTAISTATVSQPLELKKLGVGDLTLVEGLQSFLAESPNDLMAAILRKHPLVWRRVILVGRARGP